MSFTDVWKEFYRLEAEVDTYFALLSSFESEEEVHLDFKRTLPSNTEIILKGASFLILYNLVEAIARSGMQSLFDNIKQSQTNPHLLTEKLLDQWIHQRQKGVNLIDASPKVFMAITRELIANAMSNAEVELSHKHVNFSGNIDIPALHKVFTSHGIPFVPSFGEKAETVKQNRNQLSHGNKSFETCGREYTLVELKEIKCDVIGFVKDFLGAIQTFSDNASFLKKS